MPRSPCSELAKTITELAMAIGERPDVKNLDDVLRVIQSEIPDLRRPELVASIIEATTGVKQAKDELKQKLADLRREARTDRAVRDATTDLQRRLDQNQGPPSPKPRRAPPDAIRKLREERDQVRDELSRSGSTPAERQRIRERIAELNRHLKAGTVPERAAPAKAVPADIAALRKERDDLRARVMKADPAVRAKLNTEIAAIEQHIKAGTVPPKATAAAKAAPTDVEALRKRKSELTAQMNRADPAKRQALRDEIATLQQHIDDGTRPAPEKKPDTTPADLVALRQERDALKQRMDQEDTARARIATLEKHIREGTIPSPEAGTAAEVDPAVAALRAKADALQAALQKSDPALRKKFETQIAELTERLELGVDTPEPVTPPALSKDLERLVYQRDRLRAQIRQRINDLKPKNLWQRYGAEALNLQRSAFTAIDLSAIGRQGGWVGFSHPVQHVRIMKQSFAAMRAPARAHAIHQSLLDRPNAPLYKRAELYIAPEHGGLSGSEEAFMSRLAQKVPGLAASERQYTTFLNVLRADLFDNMVSNLSRNGEPTLAEARHIANYVNIATGRGSLHFKGLDKAADALATTFFSPRYMASRLQMLTGQPIWGAGGGSMRTRMLIAKEYGRSMTGIAAVLGLGLLAGGQVETDPRSSDFLKLRFGNTRIDMLSGLSQYMTFAARMATEKTKDRDGRVRPADPGRTAAHFFRTKLAPVPAALWNAKKGKDPIGEETSLLKEAGKLMVPISVRDIYRNMRDDGIPKGTAESILTLFGFPTATYE